jgi:hypothetical protein
VLFLDEPTSGLDPGTEGEIMRLFRQLADQGRTVICTTHMLENIHLFDKVIVLTKGGKLGYCGTPDGMFRHFGVKKPSELYDLLNDAQTVTPDGWRDRFEASPERGACRPHHTSTGSTAVACRPQRKPAPLEQLRVLLGRFAAILVADSRNLALMMILQPFLIAFFVWMVCSDPGQVAFLTAISAVWLGCSNAAVQIVKEWPIYERERLFNLRILDYVLSKLIALAAVSAVQCMILLAFAYFQKDWNSSLFTQWLILWTTTVASCAIGLAVSAHVANVDKANTIVPILLIPQLVFGGMLVPPNEMSRSDRNVVSRAVVKVISWSAVAFWSHRGLAATLIDGQDATEKNVRRYRHCYAMVYPKYDFIGNVDSEKMKAPDFLKERQGKKESDNRLRTTMVSSLLMIILHLTAMLALTLFLLKRRDIY